ncbi:MarR family winged helix-turn-helix transcriptional regulator [Larkinella rosea]|uniref:MarR family transcriptional regulator n=1 Tax=Larkinella rosea TaxID=2025312 RepID=A0A3P1BMA0_9BACT|nr:MarR family winged helix-turn-helix transcriptional regulator [Larkinella rosea]RRB02197.1 MarR family transcriptional regulator [Larkinella rosea]
MIAEKKRISKYSNCLNFTANALARVMTNISDDEFGRLGLTASHAFVLKEAIENPGIQPKELSGELHLTPSTITRLIEKLELKKLVERKIEGKHTLVYATEKGIVMLPDIKKAWDNLMRRYADILGDESSRKMTDLLYGAVKALGKDS